MLNLLEEMPQELEFQTLMHKEAMLKALLSEMLHHKVEMLQAQEFPMQMQ